MLKQIVLCFTFIFLVKNIVSQTTIKQYYYNFPYQFKVDSLGTDSIDVHPSYDFSAVDTIIDDKNAYLRIQSKPNDCCHDHVVFTFFKTTSNNKIFACEKGVSTTVDDKFSTKFYSNDNGKWEDVTTVVFPFNLTFKDFYKSTRLPATKFQKFISHIQLPKQGKDLIVSIVMESLNNIDEFFPDQKDHDTYINLFFHKNHNFNKLIFSWDKTKGVFKLKGKQLE